MSNNKKTATGPVKRTWNEMKKKDHTGFCGECDAKGIPKESKGGRTYIQCPYCTNKEGNFQRFLVWEDEVEGGVVGANGSTPEPQAKYNKPNPPSESIELRELLMDMYAKQEKNHQELMDWLKQTKQDSEN